MNFLSKSLPNNPFLISLFFLIASFNLSAQATISYDSIQANGTRNDTLTFAEDFADAKYALNSLFVSNDSLSFRLQKVNANGAISATVADDTLTISSLKDGYGQASVEVTATNTADQTTLSQRISVIVTAVDDAPALNPDNRFADYYSNQLTANKNILIDCVNGFVDVDDDGYGLAISFTNLSNATAGYTDLDTSMVTDIGNGQFNIAVAANTKYAADVNITAEASGKSFTKTVKLIIDNAPALTATYDTLSVYEDFATFKLKANVLFADADNGDPDSIKVTFADYLADSLTANTNGIIENDTNNIVLVTYEVAEDEFTFTSQADKIGTYKLPVSVTSGFRTVNDTMTIVVNNVDDKATIVNSIPDQLLPQGTRLAVSIEEIFEDIDNNLDYTKFQLSTSNASSLKIQKKNTNGTYSDLSSPHTLAAGESTLYILAAGSIDDKGSIKFESSNVGTSTANVNGALNNATALVVDNNAGDIKVGDLVSGTGIVGAVRVEKVTNQNTITLTSAQTIADNVALTFTASLTEFFTLKISRSIGVFYVSKSGNDTNLGTTGLTAFATIGKAILQAQNRDTIKIGEGTYQENLVINEGLTIQSTSYSAGMSDADIKKTVIKGQPSKGSVLTVLNTEGVTIRGLAIQGSGQINTDEEGSNRGWVYENGSDPVPQTIIDHFNWRNNDDKDVPDNRDEVMASFINGGNKESQAEGEGACCVDIWIEAPTVTAKVNGSTSGATAVVLDGNVGTIEVGDIVTGTGISGTVTVTAVTNQNNITLSSPKSLADNADLTFTFPSGQKTFKFEDGGRSFYQAGPGKNYADAVQNVAENIPEATVMRIDSKDVYDKFIASDPAWSFTGMKNIELRSVRGAGIAVGESSVDIDYVHIYDHKVSQSDWVNAAGVFARDAKKINISNSSIYNNNVQNGDGAGVGVFWSNELSFRNNKVYNNDASGDNNCTAGGLIFHDGETVSVVNSVFYDNEERCGASVRIGNTENYTVNHSLIENGFIVQDAENNTGLIQNSIFLDRNFGQWGPTKPSKLTIQNNLINSNFHLDYEVDRYGANNLMGASTAFADEANNDYQLTSSSVLIGAGIASNDVLDIKGNTRPNPNGSKPDIGPYENSLDKPDLIFAPFFATQTSPHCCSYSSVDLFDADNDGIDEVLYISRTDDNDSYVVKLFDAADSSSKTLHEDWSEYSIAKPLDINQDGFLDVVIINSSKIAYLLNNGSGAFAAPTQEYSEFGIDMHGGQQIQWGDITGDGRIDGVRRDWSGIQIYEFLPDGPSFSSKELNRVNNEWIGDFNQVFVADINGDTKTDVIMERRWNGQSEARDLMVYLQDNGDLVYNEALSIINKLGATTQNSDRDITLDFGDFDGDGAGDLLVAYTPEKANSSNGYLRRFELTNNDSTWTEIDLNMRISTDSVISASAYFGAVFEPKLAVLKDGTVNVVAFVSNEGEDEWHRIFTPAIFDINSNGELVQKKGYYSSETFIMTPWDGQINYDLGRLDAGSALDLAVHGRTRSNGSNRLSMFTNTNTVSPTSGLAAPSVPIITIAGSKVTISFTTSSDYYNIKVCEGSNCNILYTTSTTGGVADVGGLIYAGAGKKELIYYLKKGTYSVSVKNIDAKFGASTFANSSAFTVEGLDFAASTELIDDFFNEVHLINMDADVKPEAYGYKRRFWSGSGEQAASLKIFNLDNNNFKSFTLDNEASLIISDFDSNGKPDIIADNHSHDWPTTPFYTFMNIDENSSANVFSESFNKLSLGIRGGRHGTGITTYNRAIDIDQDGRDELITGYANNWSEYDGGIGLFSIESDDFNDTTSLWLRGEDTEDNGVKYKGVGPLFWSKMDASGRSDYRGMAHTYLNPDGDGDTDHLIAINMNGSGLARSALYAIESKSSGAVQGFYLNSFADKSIIDMQIFGEDPSKYTIMLSYTTDSDYWSDAFRTREIGFLKMEISKSGDFFQNLKKASESVTKLLPVNYKNQTNSAIAYTDFALEGMPITNSFAIADINNDGLNDIVGVGSNTSDTWNGQAILNFYLQNANGGLDQYISQVATEAKGFSFISSINLIDINADQKVDVVISGRTRQSDNGNTLGFINNTSMTTGGALSAPTSLLGQNNGYKVELTWSDTNSGKIGYATQVGTAENNFNLSRGNLNASGYPLFPDRFESFQQSKRQVFDAYDLADAYYFKVKAIDQYGNTSAFSTVSSVSISEPFKQMIQDTAVAAIANGNVAWGDYDRDGDLDLALMGTSQGYTTKLYRNDTGVFRDSKIKLARQSEGDLGWVDFDNDGFLDLVVTGKDLNTATVLNIYKNIGGDTLILVDNGEPIGGVTDATLAFGDSDADGDIDMVLAGLTINEDGQINYIMELYENKYNSSGRQVIFGRNSKFYREGFTKGDIEFADLDNDGDLEIIYAGTGKGDNPVGGIINNTRAGLTGGTYDYSQQLRLAEASISVGDIDSDGDLDIIATGISGQGNDVRENVTRIFTNEYYAIDSLRAYIEFNVRDNDQIQSLADGDIDLIDFDNDGDLDALISGKDKNAVPTTVLYAQSGGSFFVVKTPFDSVTQSSVRWADFDTDGDMDVFISGKTTTKSITQLFENNTGNIINQAPSVPANLTVTDFGFGKVRLSWDRASDDFTEKSSIAYVIALGDEDGKSNIFTTESNLKTGARLTAKPSAALQDFLYLELDPGKYNFSVQAVDANYNASAFSQFIPFEMKYAWKELNLGGIVDNKLPAGEDASLKFSDFDGDGDFDLGIFGKNPDNQWELGLLGNNSGSFRKIYDFESITKGDFDWADVNGDGTLDVFMTGEDPNDETTTIANLYLNYSDQVVADDSSDDDGFDDGFDDEDWEPFKWTTDLLVGNWRVFPMPGAISVGQKPYEQTEYLEDQDWWLGRDGNLRDCYTDDLLTFGADGSFSIDFQDATWIEGWQIGDTDPYSGRCGDPNDPNILGIDVDGNFTYKVTLPSEDGLYGVTNAEITVFGVGAYIGIPKAFNGGEMADSERLLVDPDTITQKTYTYRMVGENTMVVSIEIQGGNIWQFFLYRDGTLEGQGQGSGESVAKMDPYGASSEEPVTVYFNLTLGNQGLNGYEGDIYAHTGVQTNLNDLEAEFPWDWSYQIGEWGDNSVQPKLEKVAENYYKMDIPTSIREFYGVPDDEKIINMTFVLRSEEPVPCEQNPDGCWRGQVEDDGSDILVGVNTEDESDNVGGRVEIAKAGDIQTIYDNNKSLRAENDFSGNVYFESTPIYFKPLVNVKSKFIDFNNDGIPELIYAGSTSSTSAGVAAVYVYFFETNGQGAGDVQAYELKLENEFPVLTGSSIAFGDVDNDGDYDLVLAGSSPALGRVTDVYLNEGLNSDYELVMVKDEANVNKITGVTNGTLDLVDVDNDGDLDLVVSGDSFTGDVLQLYRNDEGVYTSISETLSGLAAMKNGRTSWGDFDGDGNADMLYSGEVLGKGEFTGLALYDQLTQTYKEDAFDLSQFTNAAVAFGDYDGDDDLDMALTGVNKNYDENDPGSNKYISKLYVNVRNESAALENASEGTEDGRTATVGKFKVNKPPSPPRPIKTTKVDNAPPMYSFKRPSDDLDGSAAGRTEEEPQMIEFSWSPSEDDNTASAGLTYALRIGTASGKSDVFDAKANADGSRKVSGKGNTEHNTSWTVALEPGTYYWAVQAIDPSYASSTFSEEETFTLLPGGGVEVNQAPVLQDAEFAIRDIVDVGYEVGNVMGTDPNGDPISFAIISGNIDQPFFIEQSSGKIVVVNNSAFDAENRSEYNLKITGSDQLLTDTAMVLIKLEKNEAPVGESGNATISESLNNGSIVAQLVVSDANDDEILFEIVSGDDKGAFKIDNGNLVVANSNELIGNTTVELLIKISDPYGAESDITFSVFVEEEVLGFSEVLRAVKAYPNPTAGEIEIEIAAGSQLQIVVSDLSGRIVQTKQVNRTGVIIDIAEEVAGIYLMTVKDLNSSEVRTLRIVKF